MKPLKDAQIVILGAARQGLALTRYLLAQGARVTLSDSASADTVALGELAGAPGLTTAFGGHPNALLDGCDLLCLSGGVPIDLPIVLEAKRRGIALSNDAQIFAERCPAPIIGITGSAGKTTTTTLVGEMLRGDGGGQRTTDDRRPTTVGAQRPSAVRRPPSVFVGGNIGNPLIADLGEIAANDFVVMELSSFQLELMTVSPHIACVTNITPNHLDRHGTMDAYIAAKRHILEFQKPADAQVLSADDAVASTLNTHARTVWFSTKHEPQGEGAWLDDGGTLRLRLREIEGAICHRRELLLMGEHNIANVLAACAISGLAGASIESMRAVATTFKGVSHRLQLVGEINGARYYDDSIATAPERLMAALRCFDAPIVLLCGGRDKHLPWDEAVDLMGARCKHVVLFGELGPMVAEVMDARAPRTPHSVVPALADAVARAAVVAGQGDVVLLSPGGTSYDAFKDFAERGDAFAALVDARARLAAAQHQG
jgi:UDP-N-acetylmuramoylalanine--D-glutamate ligase